jgi:hypothetical protein
MKFILFFKIVINLHGLWYKTLVNRDGLSGDPISTWSRGSSVWWKDICNIDLGGVEPPNLYSVKEAYMGLIF